MIVIIDYGMGNLHSVENALKHIDCPCKVSNDIADIQKADKLILPGVGALPDCMRNLTQYGLVKVIQDEVLIKKKPILGICLGMQALFEESEEGTLTQGLGLLQGRIIKMPDTSVKIPHIGWNLLEEEQSHPIFLNMSSRPFVYYVHSYYAQGYQEQDLIGYSTYGAMKIVGLVQHAHIIGAQFHPEKSGEDGLAILKWFKEADL